MKIISALIFIVFLIIAQVLAVLHWIILLPYDFYKAQEACFTGFITNIPQEIRQYVKVYDSNGLRHNLQYLNKPETRNMVALLPVEKQAEYHNLDTKNFIYELSNGAYIDPQMVVNQMNSIDMTTLNATDIGNLAYWAIYCDNFKIRMAAGEALHEIKEHFGKFAK